MIIASIKDNHDETFLFVNDDMKALKEQLHDLVDIVFPPIQKMFLRRFRPRSSSL